MRSLFLTGIIWLALTGCSAQVDYVANRSGKTPQPDGCALDVYLPGTPLDRPYDIIGSVMIGDSGFTVDCSRATVIRQAQDQGCQAGAEALLITEIKEPDWVSTCTRLSGSLIVYDTSMADTPPSFDASKKPFGGKALMEQKTATDSSGVQPTTFEPIPFE